MRTWIIAVGLCIFYFFLPLQIFIIGNDYGFGIQGAIFRWQASAGGNSLIPITRELYYVASGIYSEKTALSIILWVAGTVVLTLPTIFSLIYGNQLPRRRLQFILFGLVGSGLLYLTACIAQYGFLFHGPAGVSLPLGILVLFAFTYFIYYYQNFIFSEDDTIKINDNG